MSTVPESEWLVVPCDPAKAEPLDPHSVEWKFPTRHDAACFAVFVETMHAKMNGQATDSIMLAAVGQAAMQMSICLVKVRKFLEGMRDGMTDPIVKDLFNRSLDLLDPTCEV